jgi:plasmid stabilization system protein ParE
MVKQVIWSPEAEKDLTNILEFYFYKVKAKGYAKKLNSIFEYEIEVILKYPLIGKTCNSKNVRVKIAGHYQIIYEITEKVIFVLRIWDSRQNPSKLSEEMRKT